MQSIAVTPRHSTRLLSLATTVVKVIVPALLLAYAYFHMSAGHLFLLSSFTLMVLAIASKIEKFSMPSKVSEKMTSCSFDGGTFQGHMNRQSAVNVRTVVRDGGSFKRFL